MWSGVVWCRGVQCGCGVVWWAMLDCGVVWCDMGRDITERGGEIMERCGAVRCNAAWCAVAWRDVVWCGVV